MNSFKKFNLLDRIDRFLGTLLERSCLACDLPVNAGCLVCETCIPLLPWLKNACGCCAAVLKDNSKAWLCSECQQQTPPFSKIHAVFQYDPPLHQWIHALKFQYQLMYAKALGQFLSHAIGGWYPCGDFPQALIPVPLSRRRLRQRGFNQVLEILRPVREQWSIPCLMDHCVRDRDTAPQAQLKKEQRKRNVRQAIRIQKPILYSHVAIVDDVVTTKNTIRVISEKLKEAGVFRVDVWCVCRA